jgi:hypothetical protein
VQVTLLEHVAVAAGKSKKEAKNDAACQMLRILDDAQSSPGTPHLLSPKLI